MSLQAPLGNLCGHDLTLFRRSSEFITALKQCSCTRSLQVCSIDCNCAFSTKGGFVIFASSIWGAVRSLECYLACKRHLAAGSLEVKLPAIWTDEKQRWEESGKSLGREEKRREEKRREEKRREEKRREEKRREEKRRKEKEREGKRRKEKKREEKRRKEKKREEKRRKEKKREEKRRKEKRRAEQSRGREEIKKRKSPKKEDPGARKGRKVAKHCVFQMICGSEGRKKSSLKRRVWSQLARWELKNCTPLLREADFKVKMYKTPQLRSTFRSWGVEKCKPLRR